jgi:hypothetical protein
LVSSSDFASVVSANRCFNVDISTLSFLISVSRVNIRFSKAIGILDTVVFLDFEGLLMLEELPVSLITSELEIMIPSFAEETKLK